MTNTKHRDRNNNNNNNNNISDETRTRSIAAVLSPRIKTCFSLFDLDDKMYSIMCACDIYDVCTKSLLIWSVSGFLISTYPHSFRNVVQTIDAGCVLYLYIAVCVIIWCNIYSVGHTHHFWVRTIVVRGILNVTS